MALDHFARFCLTAFAIPVAIAVATPVTATADAPGASGSVALPPGGPIAIYPQDQIIGGAKPLVPYGAWAP